MAGVQRAAALVLKAAAEGEHANHEKVALIMRGIGLVGLRLRRKRRTTIPVHGGRFRHCHLLAEARRYLTRALHRHPARGAV
ncbi:hypothetical protein ACFYSJ_30775 [Streptomyces sp. NPDC005248]|uniref:hypothetical protein n=1 Tax=Streptomyces sp. NPDC005248 TaxID=3364709 RepID=UPI003699F09B